MPWVFVYYLGGAMKALWCLAGFLIHAVVGFALSSLVYLSQDKRPYAGMFLLLGAPWYALAYGLLAGLEVGYRCYQRAYRRAVTVGLLGAVAVVVIVQVLHF
jgi:hypothetical protein